MTAVPALELKDLRKSFGRTEIIRGCSLQVNAGERVAVIGPNGAGKSTLFNLISGRFPPTSGEVLLHGRRIDGKKPFQINRLGLSRSFQITNIFPKLSVFENLRCGVLWSLGYKYTFFKFLADLDDANERAEQLLNMIHLHKKRDVLATTELPTNTPLTNTLDPKYTGYDRLNLYAAAGGYGAFTSTVAVTMNASLGRRVRVL